MPEWHPADFEALVCIVIENAIKHYTFYISTSGPIWPRFSQTKIDNAKMGPQKLQYLDLFHYLNCLET